MPNNSAKHQIKTYGDNALIKVVNEYLFFNGRLCGRLHFCPERKKYQTQINISIDKKYHSALQVAFPEVNVQIRTCDYALCLSGEFNNVAAVDSFFDSLCRIYESFFILSVEDPNPEDADLYEGTATIDTYRWRFHLSAEDDPWPFRLHGHHGNQVLDIRTGDVYNHSHRKTVMRGLNPQSLRQIQEKVRQHPDLKEFL
ncbi:MAG: hypothetical protein Q4F75_01840 [Pseudomonadota bacterium]|nr:hypothetical protein [Pseudomonadota bacterium]